MCENMLQLLLNTIVSAFMLAIISWSFGIIFNSTKILHIAHSISYIAAVYFFITINPIVNNWIVSSILALTCSVLITILMEVLIYRPLYDKGVNQNITLISSLGIQILGVNIIAMIFGNETQMLDLFLNQSYLFGSLIITKNQLLQLFISMLVLVSLFLLFRYSNLGIRIKSVADNDITASVLGINIPRIRISVFSLGAIIVGIAALLKATDTGVDPNSGMEIVLSAIVVVILNERDSITGVILIALIVTALQNLSEWYFSSEIKEAVTYILLIAVMLLRTEGILEYKMRVEEN